MSSLWNRSSVIIISNLFLRFVIFWLSEASFEIVGTINYLRVKCQKEVRPLQVRFHTRNMKQNKQTNKPKKRERKRKIAATSREANPNQHHICLKHESSAFWMTLACCFWAFCIQIFAPKNQTTTHEASNTPKQKNYVQKGRFKSLKVSDWKKREK